MGNLFTPVKTHYEECKDYEKLSMIVDSKIVDFL